MAPHLTQMLEKCSSSRQVFRTRDLPTSNLETIYSYLSNSCHLKLFFAYNGISTSRRVTLSTWEGIKPVDDFFWTTLTVRPTVRRSSAPSGDVTPLDHSRLGGSWTTKLWGPLSVWYPVDSRPALH